MSEDTTEVTTPTEEAKPSDATAEAPPEPRAFVVPKTKKGEIVVEILDANRNVVEVAVIEGPVPFRLGWNGVVHERCTVNPESGFNQFAPVR